MVMVIDHELVDSYVNGLLSSEDKETFELQLLEDDELQDAVIATRMLKEGLKYSTHNQSKLPLYWAVAATLLLAVSTGFIFIPRDENRQMIALDSVIYVERWRNNNDHVSTIPANQASVLSIDIGSRLQGPLAATVKKAGNSIFHISDLSSTPDQYVNLLLPALPGGQYTLVLKDHSSEQIVQLNVKE